MKRANGTGTICKLYGNRRRPWAVKIPIGFSERGIARYKYLSYHKSKREAEQALAVYNQDPYALSKYTLKELYDEFYADQEQKKAPRTLCNHRTAIKHLEPLWDVKVQNLDRLTLQRFFLELDGTPSVINNVRRTLQGIINLAVTKGIMPVSMINILKAVDLSTDRKNNAHEHTVIPKATRDWLWEHKDEDMVRLILVYIYTGCRYAELYNLRPEDYHDNYIEIVQAKTEAGVRIVPLSDRVQELLPIMDVPPYTTFLKMFKQILPDHLPHDTRHTFISMMVEAKIDMRIIQSIVGHSRGTTVTEKYTHISLEAKLEAVNSLTT